MTTMVEVKQLTKRFKSITAVNDISFKVERGEVLGFLGPNGAGKSTTMKMITGFLSPDKGSVFIQGKDCDQHPITAKRTIGYLPEGAPLYGDMTPRLFLEFVGKIRGIPNTEIDQRLADVIDKVNLESVLDQSIDTLSKGFKRRVGLAQAILHDPDVLILDEPTDGLDPNQKHEVRNLISDMAQQKAIILSTHILEEVDAVCTRAIIIADGKVVADGKPGELQAQSPWHNAVVLSIRAASENGISGTLAALDNVEEVQPLSNQAGVIQFLVRPKDGTSIIENVSASAHQHGWLVEEMHVEQGRLDEVFREVTNFQRS
ncbi:MAG: ABC transporter ATP-binding protein [Arenicellales bacterium]|nr:ABC transporter ATP-binding protein [Arenicellales bacterium]